MKTGKVLYTGSGQTLISDVKKVNLLITDKKTRRFLYVGNGNKQ